MTNIPFRILCDATGETVDTLTIGHISSGFNLDNVKLNSVLPASENEKLYELLLENAPTKTEETLTIGDINFDLSTVKLSTVMEGQTHKLISISQIFSFSRLLWKLDYII